MDCVKRIVVRVALADDLRMEEGLPMSERLLARVRGSTLPYFVIPRRRSTLIEVMNYAMEPLAGRIDIQLTALFLIAIRPYDD